MIECADVVRSVLSAYNRRDWVAIADACAPGFSFYDNTLASGGNTKEEYVRYWQGFSRAMTNQVVSDVDIAGSADFVVATMTCSGNHDGADFLPGMAANGKRVNTRLCALWRCDEHGKLVSNEWFWDMLTVLRGLGHVDIPGLNTPR
jgi:steroid delta-isomerase-like uncharacterized protein